MKPSVLILLYAILAMPGALAQQSNVAFVQSGPAAGGKTIAAFRVGSAPPIVGAPYSGTIQTESVQTLADGNRIVQSFAGNIARDSQGRTRQDAPLPPLGNLAPANAPHLVFIQDPVSRTSYTLNLTNQTAQRMPMPPAGGANPGPVTGGVGGEGGASTPGKFFVQMRVSADGELPPPIAIQSMLDVGDNSRATSENLGSQYMQGVLVNGVRTTRTIAAGQIGNDRPITIVTEVWTSPDLKTVIYSKRSDPRIGDETFSLTNIVRAEPDPSLFSVPADFKIVEGPQPIIYRPNQ